MSLLVDQVHYYMPRPPHPPTPFVDFFLSQNFKSRCKYWGGYHKKQILFCNFKLLKKVVTMWSPRFLDPGSSTSHVWLFSSLKASKNQPWKQSNMAYSTSAEEDFQARAALLLILHWSYSHCFSRWRYWAKHWSSNALRRCNYQA